MRHGSRGGVRLQHWHPGIVVDVPGGTRHGGRGQPLLQRGGAGVPDRPNCRHGVQCDGGRGCVHPWHRRSDARWLLDGVHDPDGDQDGPHRRLEPHAERQPRQRPWAVHQRRDHPVPGRPRGLSGLPGERVGVSDCLDGVERQHVHVPERCWAWGVGAGGQLGDQHDDHIDGDAFLQRRRPGDVRSGRRAHVSVGEEHRGVRHAAE